MGSMKAEDRSVDGWMETILPGDKGKAGSAQAVVDAAQDAKRDALQAESADVLAEVETHIDRQALQAEAREAQAEVERLMAEGVNAETPAEIQGIRKALRTQEKKSHAARKALGAHLGRMAVDCETALHEACERYADGLAAGSAVEQAAYLELGCRLADAQAAGCKRDGKTLSVEAVVAGYSGLRTETGKQALRYGCRLVNRLRDRDVSVSVGDYGDILPQYNARMIRRIAGDLGSVKGSDEPKYPDAADWYLAAVRTEKEAKERYPSTSVKTAEALVKAAQTALDALRRAIAGDDDETPPTIDAGDVKAADMQALSAALQALREARGNALDGRKAA